jgi:hypothetical protein
MQGYLQSTCGLKKNSKNSEIIISEDGSKGNTCKKVSHLKTNLF